MITRRVPTLIATGIVVLIPLGITVFILRFLYGLFSGFLLPFLSPLVDDWAPWARFLLTTGLTLAVVILAGTVATNVVGRRIIAGFEKLMLRIPIVRVVYQAAKQVVDAFSRPRSGFQSVVMVEFPRPGMNAVGFLTNTIVDHDGATWNTVFIPTTPNPTTGFLQVVPEADVRRLGWSVETAFKTVMSLGALAPAQLDAPQAPTDR